LNSFILTAKRGIDATGAIGLISKAGRYGGTYAHKDIAFEFASWVSVEFKLYLIKEFQRLKDEENDRLKLGWNLQRTLSKINYRIHTDAIRETLIPRAITKSQTSLVPDADRKEPTRRDFVLRVQHRERAQHPGKRGHPFN
jgi:hypothetical protein